MSAMLWPCWVVCDIVTVIGVCFRAGAGSTAGWDSILLGHDNKHWLAMQGDNKSKLCCPPALEMLVVLFVLSDVVGQHFDSSLEAHCE